MAVVCLGTCTLHSKELAKTHMVLLLQVMLHTGSIHLKPHQCSLSFYISVPQMRLPQCHPQSGFGTSGKVSFGSAGKHTLTAFYCQN